MKLVAKNKFRKGRANLPVCLESPQRFYTYSTISFDDCHTGSLFGELHVTNP